MLLLTLTNILRKSSMVKKFIDLVFSKTLFGSVLKKNRIRSRKYVQTGAGSATFCGVLTLSAGGWEAGQTTGLPDIQSYNVSNWLEPGFES